MTHATTTTTVRLVEAFHENDRANDYGELFGPDTDNRIYQTLDGHTYVVTSYATQDEDYPEEGYPENVVAWQAQDETGLMVPEAMIQFLFDSENVPHVDGPNTDENHEAALALLGFSVERQEDAA